MARCCKVDGLINMTLSLFTGLLDHSFCRDPDSTGKPWCFVETKTHILWQACAVPKCVRCLFLDSVVYYAFCKHFRGIFLWFFAERTKCITGFAMHKSLCLGNVKFWSVWPWSGPISFLISRKVRSYETFFGKPQTYKTFASRIQRATVFSWTSWLMEFFSSTSVGNWFFVMTAQFRKGLQRYNKSGAWRV